ncbi:MAG: class I SAM-dependent methyltransferase [Piscinibacter sp.]|uniref:class I SAM-dependent DNA methyltransferase n=1 Tax=Piscinibacter sp. TaxID=1903157 RepID=UPI003D09B007
MSQFDLYAAYYDLLYRDKDYASEARYVDRRVRAALPTAGRLLELGCGTGGHAVELAGLGYSVHGVDLSPAMVERAAQRRLESPALSAQLSFEQGDVRSVRVGRRFDAVISLFHVISYQTTNADLAAAFTTARAHLDRGGVFVFDCWYGPAVLSDRPRQVDKRVADDQIEVLRRTRPEMHVNLNCVDVHFDIAIAARVSDDRREVRETHRMRYLFLPEIEHLLRQAGFDQVEAERWMTGVPLDDSTWYACIRARAV